MKQVVYIIQKAASMHYLSLDIKVVNALTKDENKRVLCIINDNVTLHAAILMRKELGHYIMLGSPLIKEQKWKAGQVVNVKLEIDQADYQFEMPIVLKEVLNTDPEANAIFQNLTAGNQRSLMYLVTMVKSSDKQVDRALKIAANLKLGIRSARLILKNSV